jgi:hypothetical protein
MLLGLLFGFVVGEGHGGIDHPTLDLMRDARGGAGVLGMPLAASI